MPETTEELTESAVQAARVLRIGMGRLRRRLRENYDRAELTASQTAVLSRLDRDGPASASELAAAEGVRPQSMATTVAALVGRGFARRDADPDDGRRLLVTLTPVAREWITSSRAAGQGWLARTLQERLSDDELHRLVAAMELLERVTEA